MSVLNRTRRDNQQETKSALKSSAQSSAAPSRPKFKSRPKAARIQQTPIPERQPITRQRNPQPNANGRPYAFPQAAALVQPNAERIQGRWQSAENPFQAGVATLANTADAALGGGKAIGAGIGAGIGGAIEQTQRGLSPNSPGQTAQGSPPAQVDIPPVPGSTQARTPQARTPQANTPQVNTPNVEASGAPPQQPQVPGESPSGIYTFTDDNGVRTFTDQRVPGSEPYAPGGISISGGGGGGGAAPQFGGVSAGPFGGSVDVGGGMSAAELENTRLGQRIRQQVVGGGRLFGTQNGGTGIGGAPSPGALNRAYQQELEALDRQIQHGLTTSTPGQRLTVGGLNALMGRRNELTQAQTDLFGDQTDLAETGINAQTGLQRQQLRNQGQLDRTALQGQMSAQRLQQRINDPFNQARAQVLQRELGEMGIQLEAPVRPDPTELSLMSPQEQQMVMQRYSEEENAFGAAGDAIIANGGDVIAAREELLGMLDEATTEADVRMLKGALLKLAGGGADTGFIPRQPVGLANGGLVQGPVQNFANGGLVGGQQPGQLPTSGSPNLPMQGGVDAIQNYQKYVQLARQMKVPPVDFQQFAQMGASQPSPNAGVPQPELQRGIAGGQQVMGFAEGGLVPQGGALDQLQADEKLIMDTDPNAPTDSIPATIDGVQPARLDSGEFVLPADVVQFFGTQKLQKLIEQARRPQEPQQSAGVQSGTPA